MELTNPLSKSNINQSLRRLIASWPTGWPASLIGLSLFLLLGSGYVASGQPLRLEINDQAYPIRTHQGTVREILQERALTLAPEDRVQPGLEARPAAGQTISIRLARPITVEADGRRWSHLTHAARLNQLLAELGLSLNDGDQLLLNGQPVEAQAGLPAPEAVPAQDPKSRLLAATTPRGQFQAGRPQPVELEIRRAMPVSLHDERAHSSFYTTQPTVGQALEEQGLTLLPGDQVTPALDTALSPGMRLYIKRATPVMLNVDGQTIDIRTQRETVGQLLAEAGISLMGQDFSRPPLEASLSPNQTVEIVRVQETLEIEQEFIPFETRWIPDETMALDQQEVRQPGATGVIKNRSRVRYENGQEIWRQMEDEWLDQTPSDRILVYGTDITIRTLETETGPVEYWRRVPMLTTAYNAATSGKAPDHPRYGITRIGVEAGYGIVAVDPRVVRLRSKVYVPGYGLATAGDTGGGILGKRIDLGYDDDEPPPIIYEWRDVYLLTPVPPADQIRYVLPQWPQR